MLVLIILEVLRLCVCGVYSCFKSPKKITSKSSSIDKLSDISQGNVQTTKQHVHDHDNKMIAESYYNQKQDLNKTN